ncbi:ATP-binding protein [Streptomyces melanogenes]|uniref:ATP-binding protein n=1 Tax=Streptomyces melanogenes TaxID=67326 RepID=UPI001E4D7D1E|nr:ATP-binding protein [Streptomyces melanogenes]
MKGRRTSGARRRLFERENELLLLEGMLDDLCGAGAEGDTGASSGGLLAVSGAAGLGKTSLLAEVRREAVARGCTLLTARGGEQEQGVAFHVVRQLVQPVLAAAGESEHRRILGTWYDIVAPAVGLVALPGGSPDPQGVRDGLDWLVTRFAVEHTPVVLIVDDAHWADDESLTWLSSFALRAAELPILIVVAYRPEELPAQASEFRRLAERHGSRPVTLAPLSPHGVGRLVHEVLQNGADDLFSRECWALTGGNPFEAVELIAKIRERNIKPHYANAAELRELASLARGSGLVERLERLGPSPVRLAWAVAILGTAVDPHMASSVGGLGVEESADAIQRLREARILAGRTGDSDRWTSSTRWSARPSTAPSRPRCGWRCTARRRSASPRRASAPRLPPATSLRCIPRTTAGRSSSSGPPRASACGPVRPRRPGAAWPAPCANRPPWRSGPRCCSSSAARRS